MAVSFEIRDLTVTVRGRRILSVPHLTLPKNQRIAVIGPNGAGKSTLLRALLGVSGGDIRLDGLPAALAVKRRRVAWLGQHGRFTMPLTVRDYVLLGREEAGAWFGRRNRKPPENFENLLDMFDLSRLKDRRIASLSGGEQQRAAIVRVLLQGASVLLLDEPGNHLDIRHRQKLMTQLRDMSAELTSVAVMHDLSMVANHSDFTVLLNEGRVIAAGDPREVMSEERLSAVYRCPLRRVAEGESLYFHF